VLHRLHCRPACWASGAIHPFEFVQVSVERDVTYTDLGEDAGGFPREFAAAESVLIRLRKVSDGVVASNSAILAPLGDDLHLAFHCSLIVLLCLRFSAAGLIVSLRRRKDGRRLLSVVVPAAAALASVSALSLPMIPVCPAVHRRVNKYLVAPLCFRRLAAVLRKLSAIFCPDVARSVVSVLIAA
jgi:ABC-type transport system involved in cytochrome c biogenesis permease subunit